MKKLMFLTAVFSFLSSPAFAQLTFSPNTPPAQLTPPTETYHHFASHQKGPKTVLVMLVRPSDAPAWTDPPAFATLNSQLDDASQRYYSASYHQTWFGPKRLNSHDIPRLVVTQVLNLPKTADEYRASFWTLQNDCLAAVRAQGGQWNGGSLDPNNFDRWVPMSNVKMISSTGLAYVGGRFAWVGHSLTGGVTLHEWGHNWGVYHANAWTVPEGEHPRSTAGHNSEYQDGWCVMGGNSANVMFNPQFRLDLGFLERSRGEALDVSGSGTYRIHNYVHADRRQNDSLVRALVIPMANFTANNRLILGFGHTTGTDGGWGRSDYNRNAVTVHSKLSSGSNRIDTTPFSRPGSEDRNDSSIKIGRTYSEGPNVNGTQMYGGFHITPVLRGSTVVNGQTHEWIEVVVNYENDIQNNQPPTASFPQTLLTGVEPGVPYELTVTASDPDGDSLAFDWDFGDDTYNIVNSGTQTKTWDTAGVYLVTVTVSDMKGGTDTAEMWVNVGNVPFRAPENPAQTLSGLRYTYYEGVYNQLPNWGNLLPVKQGTVANLSLEPRNRNSNFAFVYEGYVEVPADDVYTFTLRSRDGSRLYIGDSLLMNNDGLQSLASPVSGNIPLNAGKHRIRVEMFNRDGNATLGLEWSTLSMASTEIPDAAFFQEDPVDLAPPAVSITYPTPGMLSIVGSDIEIAANATSEYGIDRVVFFIGSAYLGEDSTLPYSLDWTNLPVGSFFITAVAYDTLGNFTVSDSVLLDVTSPIQRDSIGINFLGTYGTNGSLASTDQAGAFFMQAHWNNAPQGNIGETWDATVNNLKDRDGEVTSSWTRYRSRNHANHSPSGSTLVDNSTTNGRLMYGGLRVRGDTAGPVVEVGNIPFDNYDVFVYFDHHESDVRDVSPNEYVLIPNGESPMPSIWGHNSLVAGDGVGDYPNYDTWVGFKESTATGPNSPVDERLGNYIIFRDVSASMFRLEANNNGSAINAVQIVSTAENPTEPMIYGQPQSLSLPETRTAEFRILYVGFPAPSVNWYKAGTGALGITGDKLVLENISPSDAGDYYAVVTNSEGTDTSNIATLTVTDPPPAAPTDLVAVALGTSEIELTWTDNADDEEAYLIYRSASATGPWALAHTAAAEVTEYVDSNLPESTTFYYYVSAVNEKGESNPSNIAEETTLTSPQDVEITLQPVTTGATVGQSASLTVEATGYPAPAFQWRKDGVDIPGANAATFILESATLSDHGTYTVHVSNMQSEVESAPAMIVVTEPFPFAINPLHVINGGTVSENDGTYTMSRSGTDVFQGIVSNFQEVPLLETGDYVELSFSLRSNTGNNSGRSIGFGFFHGPNVTGNAQTMVTDLWEGYLHQPGSRSSAGNMSYGLARQGAGPIGLMDYAGGGTALDGVNHAANMSGLNQTVLTPVTLRLERMNSTQIRLRSVFTTPDSNRNGSGTHNGIAWSFSTVDGVCTVNSTFPVANGPEVFNGFAIATRGNWVLQVHSISTNVDLEAPALPPPAPENLIATAISGSQIDLAWTDPTDLSDPTDGFRIERSADGNSGWALLDTVTGTGYSDTGLTGGSTWYYRVIAERDGISSAPSTVVSATTPADPAPPVITQHPQSQTVGEGENATFTVTATGNPAPSFQWRKNGDDLGGQTTDTLNLIDVGSTDAANYTVFVFNGVGDGVESDVATLTVTAPPPPAPTDLQATAVDYDQIDLIWTDPTDPSDPTDGFRIERSADGTGNWITLTTVTGTEHSDTGIAAESTWHYRVIALRDGLESEPSNVASATTPAAPAAPVITSQPQSQSAFEGANVTFGVTATGNPAPTYQWRKGGEDLPDATDSTLTLNSVTFGDAGNYTVFVDNGIGDGVESDVAVLTVNEAGNLLIYEGFDYDISLTNLDGQPPTGEGLAETWSQRHIGPGESNVVAGLEFGPLVVSGNAFQLLGDRLTSGSDRFNVVSIPVEATTNANTLWSSHLVEFRVRDENQGRNSTNPDARWQDRVGFFPDQMSRTDTPRIGFSATGDGSTSEGRVALAGGNTDGGSALVFGEPHMIIGKVTGMHDNGTGVTKTATMWVLNLADFEAFVAEGRTESALATHHRYQLTRTVTNDTELSLSGQHLNLHTLDWNTRNFFPVYDEVRWGVDLQSVTPVVQTGPDAPEITAQPQSQTVYATQSATLSVSATGENLVYQWFKGEDEVSGATAASLVFDPVEESDAGDYQVVVSNAGGDVPSGVATLTVLPEDHSSNDADVPDLWAAEYFEEGEELPLTVDKGGVQVPLRTVYIWGLDPTDPQQVFEVIAPQLNGGGMTLSGIHTVPGRRYRLQFSDDLTDTDAWTDLGDEIDGNGDTLDFNDPNPANHRVYRIRVRKP
ncbi:MAG: immunoglobulin domain-containing protein [Verrucomicrobia bacterium]|nr:immunoglobulin domain-containing protein [Verrucomicrobiota bacterium]